MLGHYQVYEFHPVVAQLQTYCSEDLGGFYLDILKDRLYTSGANSRARRAAQNALWHITHALLRLLAPILSFTAEEAWAVFAPAAHAANGTIFTETWHSLPFVADSANLLARWNELREVRASVLRRLEEVRTTGALGSSLQAEVEIRAAGARHDLLASLGDDLRFVLITSAARVTRVADPAEEAVIVTPSGHLKCERCWHWRADVGADPAHPGICGRCVANLHGNGEVRDHA